MNIWISLFLRLYEIFFYIFRTVICGTRGRMASIYRPFYTDFSSSEQPTLSETSERQVSEKSSIHWSWITMIGPDAKDFLHRLTTVNVKFLPIGQGARGFFLTPQGKIRVYFNLWNFGPGEYAFELDAGTESKWKTELLATIDQFTFGEKFTLTDVTAGSNPTNLSLECQWIFPDSPAEMEKLGISDLKNYQTLAIDDEIRICHQGEADYGRTWVTAWGRPARLNQWIDHHLDHINSLSPSEIENWRIQAVRPRVDSEINETAIPLELGLKDGIAANKGCYPGQEVIEKIIALGSPARRLVRIDGVGQAPTPGSPILNLATPPVEVGFVTSSSQVSANFSILGLIKKIHAKEGLKVQFSKPQSTEGAIVKIPSYE